MSSVLSRYASGERRSERASGREDATTRAPVVLMVSGGADSTALLVLATTSTLDIDDGRGSARIARERLHVLHVNHRIRGAEADGDERFVRDLSVRLGVPCTVRRVNVPELARRAKDSNANMESMGRAVRYRAATALANELSRQAGTPRSAARILTAHTADDRAETFLMNVVRGTGTAGLSSIPRRRNCVVRPLLGRTHEELCGILRLRGIAWREDSTNEDTYYLRSYVRHEILPRLRDRNPAIVSALSNASDILSEEDAYLTHVAAQAYSELVRRQGAGMRALDARRLGACEVAIARRVVRRALLELVPDARLEARHIERVLSLVGVGHGSASMPQGLDARVEYGLLFLHARTDDAAAMPLAAWLPVPGSLALADGRTLQARLAGLPQGSQAPDVARAHGLEWGGASVLLDAAVCGLDQGGIGRLWVDTFAPGDVLCPLGMHGQSKKLSDLLGEARIPAMDRPLVPIVRTAPTGSVVWVAGVRADERFRCQPHTKLLLELTIVEPGNEAVSPRGHNGH